MAKDQEATQQGQDIVLTTVVTLGKLNEVLADLQVDGIIINSVTPIRFNGRMQAFVVFTGHTQHSDPYDLLVWLEAEYGHKVMVY